MKALRRAGKESGHRPDKPITAAPPAETGRIRPGRRALLACLAFLLAGGACALAWRLLSHGKETPKEQKQEVVRIWEVDHLAATASLPTGSGWADLVSA